MRLFTVQTQTRFMSALLKRKNKVDKKKVRMSLRLLNGREATLLWTKKKSNALFMLLLKVIEFLIDFSQFYFKFIKPGRIA